MLRFITLSTSASSTAETLTGEKRYVVKKLTGYGQSEDGSLLLKVKWYGYTSAQSTWKPPGKRLQYNTSLLPSKWLPLPYAALRGAGIGLDNWRCIYGRERIVQHIPLRNSSIESVLSFEKRGEYPGLSSQRLEIPLEWRRKVHVSIKTG